jgi:hypothetical protein
MAGQVLSVAYGPDATELLAQLVAHARGGDPLAPVTVVVPSAVAGATVRRRLAVDGGGLVNVAFLSLPQLAEQLGAPERVAAVPAVVQRGHIRAVLRQHPAAIRGDVAGSAATERALSATFAELAPLPEQALDAMAAVDPLAADTVDLYRRWRARLGGDSTAVVDPVVVAEARLAAGEIGGAELAARLGSVLVHLPRRIRPPEAQLLGALARHLPVVVVVGHTGDPDADSVAGELVGALAEPLGDAGWAGDRAAPAPAVPTRLVSAPDPAEEVAVAVRAVVGALTGDDGRPVRPERIAVLHRQRHPYAALLHAALTEADVPHQVASVTVLGQSVPGRVLTSALDVIDGGFRRADVAGLWRAGPLIDPASGEPIPASRWDRRAREAGVGGGLDQWHLRLQRAIDTRLRWLTRYRSIDHGPGPQLDDGGTDAGAGGEPVVPFEPEADGLVRAYQRLLDHIDALVALLTPPAESTWAAWSAWLSDVLRQLVDPPARAAHPESFEQVHAALDALALLDGVDAPPTVERLRRAIEPDLERPDRRHGRFGHGVFVGRVVDAVGADLDLVVVVGAADGQFPPRPREDPLLTDRARAASGGLLGPRALRRDEELRDVLAAFAAAPQRVLTTPRADPRDQRERQPAAAFLAACTARAGRHILSGELARLREPWFELVPSFEAGPLSRPATPRELDLGDLLAAHPQASLDPLHIAAIPVARERADLARGLEAAAARRAGRFDEWSGAVGPSGELVAPDRPRSATGLESYAKCPRSWFLRNVLHVDAIDDPTESELISPADEGSLVHQVLESFIGRSIGRPPHESWSADDLDELDAVFDEVADAYESEGRVGRPLLWSVRRQQLRHQLRRILVHDQRFRAEKAVSPAAVELGFGDGDDVVAVTLADGRQMTFHGYADRVDRSVDGRRLIVYDYKTGSPLGFSRLGQSIAAGDITARGTFLQLPIYALAAKARFPGATEVSSYYWFVGRSGMGKLVGATIDAAVERRFVDVIEVIVDGMEAGRFPANPGAETWNRGQWTFDHCTWCEFDRICPTSRGEAWVRVREAGELRRYRELTDGTDLAPAGGGDGEAEEQAS